MDINCAPLSFFSQCDALEQIANSNLIKKNFSHFSNHLKKRSVCEKIANFLTALDYYCVTDEDRLAFVEFLKEQDPFKGLIVETVCKLWQKGELYPWSPAAYLRKTNEILENQQFDEHSLNKVQIELWQPHSVFDELEFLKEELVKLNSQGVSWSDIFITVPHDASYQRIVFEKLKSWNIPIKNQNFCKSWADNSQWVWIRDVLKTIAGGFNTEDVETYLLSVGVDANAMSRIINQIYNSGLTGGYTSWRKLKEIPIELEALLKVSTTFRQPLTPTEFKSALEQVIPVFKSDILKKNTDDAISILLTFSNHVTSERPYLENRKMRLFRYVTLFEEFLRIQASEDDLLESDGITLRLPNYEPLQSSKVILKHHVLVHIPSKQFHFILGAGFLHRDSNNAEEIEVRILWEKLHSVQNDHTKLKYEKIKHLLHSAQRVFISAPTYDLNGDLIPAGLFFKELNTTSTIVKSGGHIKTGWKNINQEGQEYANLETASSKTFTSFQVTSLSISAFEDYLRCPFLFYGRHVLKLKTEDEPGLTPDVRTRGVLIHRILEKFLRPAVSNLADSYHWDKLDQLQKDLSALIEDEVGQKNFPGLYRSIALHKKVKHKLQRDLNEWLMWELDKRNQFPNLKPFALEQSIEVQLTRGLTLTGKVDRVDSDGQHAVIIDYKSGHPPFIGKEILKGLGVQLLGYMKGVETQLKLKPAAGFYLSIGQKTDSSKGVFIKKFRGELHTAHTANSGLIEADFDSIYENASQYWNQAAQNLLEGNFTANPSRPEKDCRTCIYKNICGYSFENMDS